MDLKHFLGQVQARARLPSENEALRATRATLQTLGERLGGQEPHHLASQLPSELGQFLEQEVGQFDRFSSEEFIDKVSQREGVDPPAATYHARVVLEVLGEAVSAGQFDHVRHQLPSDYQRLFGGSEGKMPRK